MKSQRRGGSRLLIAILSFFGLLLPFVSFAQDFSGSDSMESKSAKAMVAYLFPEQISIAAQKLNRSSTGRAGARVPQLRKLVQTDCAIGEASYW